VAKYGNGKGPLKRLVKMTSKGRITVPLEIRRRLGMRAGEHLSFDEDGKGVSVTVVRKESPFKKYRGIENPGIGKGRKSIQKWLRELRGE
jgi:AbrB family looped-hinge helix DNA binding protein